MINLSSYHFKNNISEFRFIEFTFIKFIYSLNFSRASFFYFLGNFSARCSVSILSAVFPFISMPFLIPILIPILFFHFFSFLCIKYTSLKKIYHILRMGILQTNYLFQRSVGNYFLTLGVIFNRLTEYKYNKK